MKKIVLKDRQFDREKLLVFGFKSEGEGFCYSSEILDGDFVLEVVARGETIQTKVVEKDNGEEYVLHLSENAVGAFVGRVREEHDQKIAEIINNCTKSRAFLGEKSQKTINYVKKTYGSELEFLWEDSPFAAIWRREDNRKWYGIMMRVPINRLGIVGDEMVDILNVRGDASVLIDGKSIFPAYHMNKKSWVSILLNEVVEEGEIFDLIDQSFIIAGKKK